MEDWYTKTNLADEFMLAVSDSGYMNDALTLDWIRHFEKNTAERSSGSYRLLLLDGYGSHCTVPFVKFCWEHRIIPFCFPPHMTHLLQPLDVVLFQPYKHHHSVAVNDATHTGCEDFNKIEFLNSLTGIRDKTFKETSVISAFQKAGIIPINAELILEKLRCLEPPISNVARDNAAAGTTTTYTRPSSPTVSSTPATPTTVRSLKRQGEELLKCDMDPEFCKNLATYVKGSQAQAERGALALEHVDLTEVAMRARSLRQQRSRTRLQNGGAVTVEQARQLARSRAQRTEEKARAKVERELNQKKRQEGKEEETKKKEERKKKREEERKQREENAQKRKEEQATRKAQREQKKLRDAEERQRRRAG
jgi:hypothetical protein